jgi:hypothetical protein
LLFWTTGARTMLVPRLVSPTVFRAAGFRFYFFSREERRRHIHVQCSVGEAKFWLDPRIELAENHGVTRSLLARASRIIEEREDEIRSAWEAHFGR